MTTKLRAVLNDLAEATDLDGGPKMLKEPTEGAVLRLWWG